MPSPAETRTSQIVKKLQPLIAWMKQNKPDRKQLHVFKDDYKWLMQQDPAARVAGFYVNDGKVIYDGFELLPYET